VVKSPASGLLLGYLMQVTFTAGIRLPILFHTPVIRTRILTTVDPRTLTCIHMPVSMAAAIGADGVMAHAPTIAAMVTVPTLTVIEVRIAPVIGEMDMGMATAAGMDFVEGMATQVAVTECAVAMDTGVAALSADTRVVVFAADTVAVVDTGAAGVDAN
jgi:hypothetical protein